MAAASSASLNPSASAVVTTCENAEEGTASRQATCASDRPMPVFLFFKPVFMAPATTSSARIRVMSCFALTASAAGTAGASTSARKRSAYLDFMGSPRCKLSRDAVARAFTVPPVQYVARHEQVQLFPAGHPGAGHQRGAREDFLLAC